MLELLSKFPCIYRVMPRSGMQKIIHVCFIVQKISYFSSVPIEKKETRKHKF